MGELDEPFSNEARCPRCNFPMTVRNPDSVEREWWCTQCNWSQKETDKEYRQNVRGFYGNDDNLGTINPE